MMITVHLVANGSCGLEGLLPVRLTSPCWRFALPHLMFASPSPRSSKRSKADALDGFADDKVCSAWRLVAALVLYRVLPFMRQCEIMITCFGRTILYTTTTTTQRGWCIKTVVSILAHLQSLSEIVSRRWWWWWWWWWWCMEALFPLLLPVLL